MNTNGREFRGGLAVSPLAGEAHFLVPHRHCSFVGRFSFVSIGVYSRFK
jgi:hypothetical protein